MALKFDGLDEPYTGHEGTEEWDDFWQKFLVLADISGWNSSKRMARLPLFLKGDAFRVFSTLPGSLKADESQLPDVMRRLFFAKSLTEIINTKETVANRYAVQVRLLDTTGFLSALKEGVVETANRADATVPAAGVREAVQATIYCYWDLQTTSFLPCGGLHI